MPNTHLLKRACSECKRIIQWTRKNKKKFDSNPSDRKKLEHKRYCRWCKKHVSLKEVKK